MDDCSRKNDIENQIRKILENNIDLAEDSNKIAPNQELQYYGMNSLNAMNVIADMELLFGLEFMNEDLRFDKINTINKLTNYVINRLV